MALNPGQSLRSKPRRTRCSFRAGARVMESYSDEQEATLARSRVSSTTLRHGARTNGAGGPFTKFVALEPVGVDLAVLRVSVPATSARITAATPRDRGPPRVGNE